MIILGERTGIEKKFYDLCKEVVGKEELLIYDLEYQQAQCLLRVFIFNEKTKTALLEECVRVDKALTPFIDTEEWIPETLTLEVSSPGVFRNLRSLEHFQRARDERISLVVSKGWEEKKQLEELPKKYRGMKKFRGILKEADQEFIILDLPDYQLKIQYDAIKKASLDPEVF